MTKDEKIEYIKSQIDEFSDSGGDLDGISLIEHVQEKFSISGREAEALVDAALGYGDDE